MNVSGLMASGSGSAGGDRPGTDKHSGFFVPSRGFGHRVNCCWPKTTELSAAPCCLLTGKKHTVYYFVSAYSLYLHMWLVYFWQQLQLSPSRLHRKAGWCYSSATVCKKTRSNQSKRYNNISNMTFKSPYRTHQPCSTYWIVGIKCYCHVWLRR